MIALLDGEYNGRKNNYNTFALCSASKILIMVIVRLCISGWRNEIYYINMDYALKSSTLFLHSSSRNELVLS